MGIDDSMGEKNKKLMEEIDLLIESGKTLEEILIILGERGMGKDEASKVVSYAFHLQSLEDESLYAEGLGEPKPSSIDQSLLAPNEQESGEVRKQELELEQELEWLEGEEEKQLEEVKANEIEAMESEKYKRSDEAKDAKQRANMLQKELDEAESRRKEEEKRLRDESIF